MMHNVDKETKKPLFSIITTVYNNEKYILKAVDSVINQAFDDYEYIIIDDGSTDSTPEIIDRISANNKKIRVIHQANQWIYASFNNGIDLAEGEYVFILNSDDILTDGSLELLKEKVMKYNYPDVIWTQVVQIICDDNQNTIKYDAWNRVGLVKCEEYYSNITEVRNAWPYLMHTRVTVDQANLYKRNILKKHRFRTDIIGADSFFNIDIASDIQSAVLIKENIYNFYIYNKESMNASEGKYFEYQKAMDDEFFWKYVDLFRNWGLSPESYEDIVCAMRLRCFTREIRGILSEQCKLGVFEKARTILIYNLDDYIIDYAKRTNRINELESRVLNGIAELIAKENIDRDGDMGFLYDLVEFIPRMGYDPPKNLIIDRKRLVDAIYNPLNPVHIGKEIMGL